jgi:exonuclease SbcC
MQPLQLTLKGFRGIRDGLGRDELTLDLERLADGARLIAIAGPNGCGKTTVMDNLTPYLTLPSRAAQAGAGGFSYYDHVCLPESFKDLTWAHEGRSYRSQVVIRAGTRRKTEAYLHVLNDAGQWQPMQIEDGTLSDGRVDTYNRCVEAVCGSRDTFLTSVFAAQGKRQLNTYRNAEIKALLADLLNQDTILALGARASEVARLLKLGLTHLRRDQETLDEEARRLDAQRAAAQGAVARKAEAQQRRQAANEALLAAQAQVARLRAERDLAVATEARRSQWTEELHMLVAGEAQALQRLHERERLESERLAGIERRAAERQRERLNLVARWQRTRQEAESVLRELPGICRAQRRLPLAQEVVDRRTLRAEACRQRVSDMLAAQAQVRVLGERVKAIEREAGQAVLRVQALGQRCGLAGRVPCAGTELHDQCGLLEDARQAQALVPDASAQVERLGQERASIRDELHRAQASCEALASAPQQRAHSERLAAVAAHRVQRLTICVARRAACEQARASLRAVEQDMAERGTDAGAETPEEQQARQQIALTLQGIADERKALTEATEQARGRLNQALAALAPKFSEDALAAAEAMATQQALALESAEQSLQQAHREAESLEALGQQTRSLAARKSHLTQHLSRVGNELGNWTLFSRCMSHDGLIALAIDDAGPALSGLANELLLSCYGPRFTVSMHTLVDTAKGEAREGFDILVHDGDSGQSKSLALMSGGERTWVEACLTRAIALYLTRHTGRRYGTLFSDEVDGALDAERKRMFMAMKRAVLDLGGYEREFFVSQSPELNAMADVVIDLPAM